ncbi:uncharacterized protein [Miscanthus floridulus]|uniref:uncharacterized protein n=1 Tax=Miscanthus floridulus TaxID=154761 RepID=UPI0034585CC9
MESSIAATTATSVVVRTCVPAAVFLPSFSSSSFISPAPRNGQAFRCRCSSSSSSATKQDWVSTLSSAVLYTLDDAPLFSMPEVIQWESGMSMNAIAAAQGIQIRRRFRARYPSEGTGADRAIPRHILEQIIWDKEVEVIQRKARTPLSDVNAAAELAPPPRDFLRALRGACHRNGGVPALIAEVKKASPSKGLLRDHFDPVEIAHAYEKNGAACLSILTDEKHFQGSFENLETVRNSGVNRPLLCKEFVIDVWQIYYARSKGADAILLMAAVLPNIDITYFVRICKSLGMTALVEVHNERELDRVLKIDGVELIGINNRSLGTFEVDTANTNMLLEKRGDIIKKKRIQVVSESGLFTPDDVAYVQNAGVFAFW